MHSHVSKITTHIPCFRFMAQEMRLESKRVRAREPLLKIYFECEHVNRDPTPLLRRRFSTNPAYSFTIRRYVVKVCPSRFSCRLAVFPRLPENPGVQRGKLWRSGRVEFSTTLLRVALRFILPLLFLLLQANSLSTEVLRSTNSKKSISTLSQCQQKREGTLKLAAAASPALSHIGGKQAIAKSHIQNYWLKH